MKELIRLILLYIGSLNCNRKASKILYYHDVYDGKKYTDMGTALEMFSRHIRIVRDNGFAIVEKITNPKGEVMICFDDGFRGIYDTKDFFIKNGIRPTVFLAVSLIGTPGYLSRKEILELQKAGFIFQCHSWSHEDLTKFSKEELGRELGEAKLELETLLGKAVDEICFPIGYFSQQVLDECKRYGYKTMYSSIPGNYFDTMFAEGLKTRNLMQYATPRECRLALLGGGKLLKNRYIKMHFRG